MSCIEEGRLRAWLDHDLPEEKGVDVANHLETCPHCREQVDALTRRGAWIAHLLNSHPEPQAPDVTEAALDRFRLRRQQEAAAISPRRIAWRPALAAAAVLVMVAGLVFTSTGRAWAEHVLTMLRIEKVTAVPVDLSPLSSPEGHNAGQMLAHLLNSDLVVTMKPQPPQPVADQAAAAQAAGFDVRLPAGGQAPAKLAVGSEAAFQITLHRDNLQAILDAAGRPDLQLPANLDNALIAVHVPRSVVARYGACPAPHGPNQTKPAQPSRPHTYPGCTILMQAPSPTVSVPPGLNLQQLATIGLELTGMSASAAANYTSTVNWTSTLVIPVPERIANSASVSVDGQQGVLIRRAGGNQSAPGYQLVWTRHGIIYAIAGWGDPAAALAMADTLQ